MLYGNHIRGLIKRKTGLSPFQGIAYRLRGKGVLYGQLERSGVLYGNHIYIVRS